MKVKHRFLNHTINPKTEILVVGTFNPETIENQAEFFYGRSRNHLWTLIPLAYGEVNLKGADKANKLAFIDKYKIDFIDLISEVDVEKPDNYYDGYLDKMKPKWRDIIGEIEKLKLLKKVCFTRKSFSDIPNMKVEIEKIKKHCESNGIYFEYLNTPARFYRADKQQEWTSFFTK